MEDQDGSELVMALRVRCACDLMRGAWQQRADSRFLHGAAKAPASVEMPVIRLRGGAFL